MRQLDLASGAIIFGTIGVCAACLVFAGVQVRSGWTRGLVGGRVVTLADEPGYFWFLFWGRIVLGIAGIAIGLYALTQPAPAQ